MDACINDIFKVRTTRDRANERQVRTALALASDLPPRTIRLMKKFDVRAKLVDVVTGPKGTPHERYTDGRTFGELPGLFWKEDRHIILPLRQKVRGFPVVVDCYDFEDAESLKAKGKRVPDYMRDEPLIRTPIYRRYIIQHEFGHGFELGKALRYDPKYQRHYEADQRELVRNGTGLNSQMQYRMTAEYGGTWKSVSDALGETLADSFVKAIGAENPFVEIPALFPRTYGQFRKDHASVLQA